MGSAANEVRAGYHGLVRREIVPLVPRMGGSLLDFGGGVGATAAHIRDLGLVERAGVVDMVSGGDDGPQVDFRHVGDVEDPAVIDEVIARDGPFSVILCLDILEHLRDPWSVVRRLHGGLAEDGVMIGSIPNVRNFQALFPLLFRNQWTLTDAGILDRTHLRFFVRDTAIELMTCSGLTLEEVRPAPSGGRKIRLIRMATLGLFNSFTDRQYLIRVRRPRG
jgi:hypothetical protein